MGGEMSLLKEVELGEEWSLSDECFGLAATWTSIHPARHKLNNSPVTLFIREIAPDDPIKWPDYINHGIKMCKQLRHPSIQSFVDSTANSKSQIGFLTERVRPLTDFLPNSDGDELTKGKLLPMEIMAGLLDIADALSFLHQRGQTSHNNLQTGSIFVSKDGSWKLGALELTQSYAKMEESKDWLTSDVALNLLPVKWRPPEDKSPIQQQNPPQSRDMYGFGKLLETLLPCIIIDEENTNDDSVEKLRNFAELCTNEDPQFRPELKHIYTVLKNELSDILSFLNEIPVKSNDEKTKFFRSLPNQLDSIPSGIICRRLCKPLLSRYVLLEPTACQYFIPFFLTPKIDNCPNGMGVLSSEAFTQSICPQLARVFCVHERTVRLVLLQYFSLYAKTFPLYMLQQVILPELLLGMKDTDGDIVSGSLRGLAEIVPILGASAVTGLEHCKYFAEGKPRKTTEEEITENKAILTTVKAALQNYEEKSNPRDVQKDSVGTLLGSSNNSKTTTRVIKSSRTTAAELVKQSMSKSRKRKDSNENGVPPASSIMDPGPIMDEHDIDEHTLPSPMSDSNQHDNIISHMAAEQAAPELHPDVEEENVEEGWNDDGWNEDSDTDPHPQQTSTVQEVRKEEKPEAMDAKTANILAFTPFIMDNSMVKEAIIQKKLEMKNDPTTKTSKFKELGSEFAINGLEITLPKEKAVDDFFKDMEPTFPSFKGDIPKPVSETKVSSSKVEDGTQQLSSTMFAVANNDNNAADWKYDDNDGWGDEEDW